MSDYMGDLQKIRQMSQFEMRRAYDSNKKEEKQKLGEYSYYNKEQALEENAVIERVLQLQSTLDYGEKLPDIAQQEIRERLFTNKAYLLVNEHSKSDSSYMTGVKTSVRDLTEALHAPLKKGKMGEDLNKISALYETAMEKCNDYLTRGTGERKVPFWPWHRQRFDAVAEMEQSLQEEKENFENNKKIVLAYVDTVDLGQLNVKMTSGSRAGFREGSFYQEGDLLIKSAMDVVLLDRLDAYKQEEMMKYVDGLDKYNSKETNLGGPIGFDELELPQQYQELHEARETVGEMEEAPLTEEKLGLIVKGLETSEKILASDVGDILKTIDTLRNSETYGLDKETIDADIKKLEAVLKPAKKNKKTLNISPEIHRMAEVLLDQLKTIKNDPLKILSKVSGHDLESVFDIKVNRTRSVFERGKEIKNGMADSAVSGEVLINSLMELYGGNVYETYKKYVYKNLYRSATYMKEEKDAIEDKVFRRNFNKNFN